MDGFFRKKYEFVCDCLSLRSTGLKVQATMAEEILKEIRRKNCLNRRLRPFSDSGYVYFPLDREIPHLREMQGEFEFEERNNEGIRDILEMILGERGRRIGWQRIGDALIFNAGSGISEKVCEAICSEIEIGQIYEIQGKIGGESRKPEIRLIYGNAHETSYRENGVNFILNPMSVMLSKGNIVERGIPYPELKSPRRVLDMFSGIGYFSLPLGRKFTLETMTCVDINNDALGYLKKSYEASGFKFELILENRDCRDISTGEKFDTIIMGNFKSLNYLPHALSHADDQCSIILHHLEPSDSISRADYEIMRKCSHLGYSAGVIDSHMVKSYSPHMWHISTLINVRRKAFDKI